MYCTSVREDAHPMDCVRRTWYLLICNDEEICITNPHLIGPIHPRACAGADASCFDDLGIPRGASAQPRDDPLVRSTDVGGFSASHVSDLKSFRHVQVKQYQEFAHPHLFLLSKGLIDPSTSLELASLSIEPDQESKFIAVAFEVALDDSQRAAFVTREPEYAITTAPFWPLTEDGASSPTCEPEGVGVICAASQDENLPPELVARHASVLPHGVWHWPLDSGLLPADVYLRHCLLAMRKVGGVAEQSFLHDTLLADKSTLAEYLSVLRSARGSCRANRREISRFSG